MHFFGGKIASICIDVVLFWDGAGFLLVEVKNGRRFDWGRVFLSIFVGWKPENKSFVPYLQNQRSIYLALATKSEDSRICISSKEVWMRNFRVTNF